MTISVRQLHPEIGAEVRGVDLSEPLAPEIVAALRDAFEAHHVLLFRGIEITDEQHVRFSRNFSDLETFPQGDMGPAVLPEIYRVSNVDWNGDILPVESDMARYQTLTQHWHTDGSYLRIPSLGAVLRSLEVTHEGGETSFANMFRAYEALPDAKKRQLATLKAVHSFQYSRTLKNLPPMKPEELARVPPQEHPLVRVHPGGRRSIYISPPLMESIVGWSYEDSQALIDDLVAHATSPAFVYRHHWSRHDLLMWDNRCTMHSVAPYDAATLRRVMHRTALVGSDTVTGPNNADTYAGAAE